VAAAAAGALVAAVPVTTAPRAGALSPPPVDEAFLPAAAPPAPPQPTEQRADCVRGDQKTLPANATHMAALRMETVWPLTRGAGQTVAVIDTGVTRHRLLPRLMPGGDYVSTGDGTDDCDGHGTLVAGIVAADGEFRGVAPEATVLAIRQSSNKFGAVGDAAVSGFGDVQTLASAIRAAADLGATVINVSSVACVPAGDPLDDRALGAALAYAVDVKNVVVVSAAGNVGGAGQCPAQNPDRSAQPDWRSVASVASPAWYDDLVLTVASVRADGAPSTFTLAGPWVDVAAPGEDVVSLAPGGEGLIDRLPRSDGERRIAGTSYAAPVVSGVAALVRSRWPQLSARQVMARIERTAHRPAGGWNPLVGHGLVDVSAAVSAGAPAATSTRDVRAVAMPAPAPADSRPRRTALAGMGICLAIALVVAASASARRGRVADR
jgi:membrane-anchored mycosin MYCP